jgi:hypothetical protein
MPEPRCGKEDQSKAIICEGGAMTSRTHTPEDIKKIDDEFKAVLTTKFFKEKKEWVGLTDEERQRCLDDVEWNQVDWCPDHEQYAKAIEAKLKEKNT